MVVLAHLSDPHLDGTRERRERLVRVVAQAVEIEADAVLVSGDLADNGRPEEYAEFVGAMPAHTPWIAVPGNHDDREVARPFLAPGSASGSADGPLDAYLDLDGVRIVALDSLVEGATEGRLADRSVERAEELIGGVPGRVALALHHPPVPVGHALMDGYGLHAPSRLAKLARHDAVTAILVGHVHSCFAAQFEGRPVLGAPGIVSTMRLGSHTDPIAGGRALPGLAVHTFDGNGWVRTVFHTLSPV